jgi:ectoine hydroxylase
MKAEEVIAIREQFRRDGVVMLPDFFSAKELSAVNKVLDDILEKNPRSSHKGMHASYHRYDTDVHGLGGIATRHPEFKALYDNPRMVEVTEAAIGKFEDEFLLVQATWKGSGQAWHQDSKCDDPTRFNLNRLIYTRDVLPERGQIVVVPGSVHRGRVPPGGHQDPIPGEVALAPRAGTLVLMNSQCWHRVTFNQTEIARVSVNFRVRPAGCPAGATAVANFRNGTYDFATRETTPV